MESTEVYFITGTSRGLGKAIATQLLERPNAHVAGIGRQCSIVHERYQHYAADLSDLASVQHLSEHLFRPHQDARRLVLINNAGLLGHIAYVGQLNPDSIASVFQLNTIAPAMLTHAFIAAYSTVNAERIVLNISSGAGKRAIDGWAAYCASKAALDLFSETVAAEQKIRQSGIRIFSVAPGTVDTDMQSQIRMADGSQFSTLERFHSLKAEGRLSTPEEAALKLITLTDQAENYQETILDIRNL